MRAKEQYTFHVEHIAVSLFVYSYALATTAGQRYFEIVSRYDTRYSGQKYWSYRYKILPQ